ncbi:zinc-binding dehydrogenase [Mesorhizobium sp. 8]|uniref:quinone oxidoreductase family protein n=1 Tax=Mesorhizobium sp. 8 TaxID=2584466 RepID=UPI0011239995|nr:zinc-binding dehydrogenase [Mesorhizobium sp. 8]QDC02185.1 zinc-binding dehydrogenase [Mesorhizobium sp. 8]
MKIIQIDEFGEPDVLKIREIARPEISAENDVLVRVHASGVNFFEVLMRRDRYAVTPPLPARFGVEVAGVVEAAGAEATLPVGSRVAVPLFAHGRDGGYADHVVASESACVPLPDGVLFDAAVALQVQGLTALHAVRQTAPEGQPVLVTAAGGGVGTLLIQLARQAGASRIVALAGSREKLDMALSLGADVAVNHRDDDWLAQCAAAGGGDGFSTAYDFVGGELGTAVAPLLAPMGTLLFGALGRFAVDTVTMNGLLARGQTVKGFALIPLLQAGNLRQDLTELFRLAASGKLAPVIGARFALEQAADAHRLSENRASIGKIVLQP